MTGATQPPARMLLVMAGGHEYRFTGVRSVIIGRAADCDIVLTDTKVSRRHLQLVHYQDAGWFLHDLDTANGTWHGETRLTARPVGAGLSVTIGHPVDGPVIELIAGLDPAGTGPESAPSAGGVPRRDGAGGTAEGAGGTAEGAAAADGGHGEPVRPVVLGERVTIGRAQDNDVVLRDVMVSRRHARIVRTPHGHFVEDLGSANLTFVNGDPVSIARLDDGDVLTCGRTRLVRVGGRLHLLPGGHETGLVADEVGYVDPEAGRLVTGLSLQVEGLTLLGVIGPDSAGKSVLLRLLAGDLQPTEGRVRFENQDVHANAAVRHHIGVVPREPVVHRRLSVRQALSYAAELRLPMDATGAERATRVDQVLDQLGLTEHAHTKIEKLRLDLSRRLAIAVEVLTFPSLLLLDEPTAGLDPGSARSMMRLLRVLTDAGLQMVITTQEPGNLELCDTVLVLAPGGQEAYYGSPKGIRRRFGTVAWADIFDNLEEVSAARTGLFGDRETAAPSPPEPAGDPTIRRLRDPLIRRRIRHHAGVVGRRQLRLIAADPPWAAVLVLVSLAVVGLALTVSGDAGMNPSGTGSTDEAIRLLTVLITGSCSVGMLVTMRDLVQDRRIYRHESAAGLLPEGYLIAKTTVYGAVAAALAGLMVGLVRVARPGPSSAVLLGSPTLEVTVAMVGTTVACCCLGLAVSSIVRTSEHAVVSTVAAALVQFLLCGGLVPLTGRPLLAAAAALLPARWGLAAAAGTADLSSRVDATAADLLWEHSPAVWLASIGMLALLGAFCTALALRRLRR